MGIRASVLMVSSAPRVMLSAWVEGSATCDGECTHSPATRRLAAGGRLGGQADNSPIDSVRTILRSRLGHESRCAKVEAPAPISYVPSAGMTSMRLRELGRHGAGHDRP